MREIPTSRITEVVSDLCIRANRELGDDVIRALEVAVEKEESPVGRDILIRLLENAKIARQERVPICQDTGFTIVFVEIGQDVRIVGGSLKDAINEGVRRGYKEGYLRKSLCHCFSRANTGDNTPAVIHFDIIAGDSLKIVVVPKGGGGENMSGIAMLIPASGISGIKEFVIEKVRETGSYPCPPTIIGVGIGGTFEQVAFLAKRSLLRPVGAPNPDPELAALETELLEAINNLGIGPQGLGGRVTSLAVHVEMAPCHIGCLPVAVNIQCHTSRHKEVEL